MDFNRNTELRLTLKFKDEVPFAQRVEDLKGMALMLNDRCLEYPEGTVRINGTTGTVIVPHTDRNATELPKI